MGVTQSPIYKVRTASLHMGLTQSPHIQGKDSIPPHGAYPVAPYTSHGQHPSTWGLPSRPIYKARTASPHLGVTQSPHIQGTDSIPPHGGYPVAPYTRHGQHPSTWGLPSPPIYKVRTASLHMGVTQSPHIQGQHPSTWGLPSPPIYKDSIPPHGAYPVPPYTRQGQHPSTWGLPSRLIYKVRTASLHMGVTQSPHIQGKGPGPPEQNVLHNMNVTLKSPIGLLPYSTCI